MNLLISMVDRLLFVCASLRLAVISLTGLATVLALATFYEAQYGADAAQAMIYRTGWFATLLGILAINIFAAVVVRFPWRRHQIGFIITHAGLLLLLFGCVRGFRSSLDGMIAIEEGRAAGHVRLKQDHFMLHFDDGRRQLKSRIPVHPRSEGTYPSLWRFLANSITGVDQRPRWPKGSVLALAPDHDFIGSVGRRVAVELLDWMPAAKSIETFEQIGAQGFPAARIILEGTLPGAAQANAANDSDPIADVWLHVNNDTPIHSRRIGPMVARLGPLIKEGAIEEFLSDDTAKLPAGALGLIELRHTSDARIYGRKVSRQGVEWTKQLQVDQAEPAFMGLKLRLSDYLPQAQRKLHYEPIDLAPNKTGIPAALVRITVGDVAQTMWLARDSVPHLLPSVTGDATMQLRYSADHVALGVALYLDRFERYTDPGTNSAAGFASLVRVVGAKNNTQIRHLISMNQPLRYGGLTFYQSGFQELPSGRKVSVLSVGRDPGRPFKYAGALLVVLGVFTMFYMQAYFGPAAEARRAAERRAAGVIAHAVPLRDRRKRTQSPAMMALAIAALLVTTNFAAGQSKLDQATLDELRSLPVMHAGRIKPFETVARQTIRQLTGKTYFGEPLQVDGEIKVRHKLDPVELLFWMMSDPTRWDTLPIIQVELLELRRWLSIPETESHVSPMALRNHPEFIAKSRDLFSRAASAEEEGTRFSPTRFEEALLDVARREGHFQAACRGAGLGLMPYPQDKAFFSWLDTQADAATTTAVAATALQHWNSTRKVQSDQKRQQEFHDRAGWINISAILSTAPEDLPPSLAPRGKQVGALWASALEAYRENANAEAKIFDLATRMPSTAGMTFHRSAIKREVFYNQLHPFRWAMALYLSSAILLLVNLQWRGRIIYAIGSALLMAALAMHIYGFYLRIKISGWAPVTNMYETVIWVALISAVIGAILELIYRPRLIALAAALVAAVCCLVSDIMPATLGADHALFLSVDRF